jgi:hypothetical protein
MLLFEVDTVQVFVLPEGTGSRRIKSQREWRGNVRAAQNYCVTCLRAHRAFGHPLGATGVRQVVTGLSELRRQEGNILCTSMCIGSGCVCVYYQEHNTERLHNRMGAAAIFVNERTRI